MPHTATACCGPSTLLSELTLPLTLHDNLAAGQ